MQLPVEATTCGFLATPTRLLGSIGQTTRGLLMGKNVIEIASAVFAFGFALALRSNAGTEMIEPYRAPAPTYGYAPPPPPPRPIYYAPPPVVGVVVAPTYGYYGPRFGFYRGHRFNGLRGSWRSHHHWR